jgi:hypothetical protein
MFRFAKSDGPIFCRCRVQKSVLLNPVQQNQMVQNFRSSDNSGEMMTVKPNDWRTPLVHYFKNPDHIANRKVRQQALNYVVLDNTLYRRTIDGLLLKCLGSNQSKIAMGEVHEGICGTHQSAHKMKWLFHCARFYWPTMLNDCFMYYKGCESC